MKHTPNSQSDRRACFVFVALVILARGCPMIGAADEREAVFFEEHFDAKLRDGWSWVRENPAAWKIENSALHIRVQPGYLHAEEPEQARTKNVLLRDLPKADGSPIAVEVCVESDPQIQFEHAGIVWYLDDANFIDVLHEGIGGEGKIQMVTTKARKHRYDVARCGSKTLWVRLLIDGNDLTGQFRESPTDAWRTVAKVPLRSTEKARVGVICGGGGKDSDRVAKFTHFRIVQVGK